MLSMISKVLIGATVAGAAATAYSVKKDLDASKKPAETEEFCEVEDITDIGDVAEDAAKEILNDAE